jgi:N-acetylglutamate synthase-like GNAT family acetyltransferase
VSGAISPDEVKQILSDLGFEKITITPKEQSEEIIRGWNVAEAAEKVVFSAYLEAVKPEIQETRGRTP